MQSRSYNMTIRRSWAPTALVAALLSLATACDTGSGNRYPNGYNAYQNAYGVNPLTSQYAPGGSILGQTTPQVSGPGTGFGQGGVANRFSQYFPQNSCIPCGSQGQGMQGAFAYTNDPYASGFTHPTGNRAWMGLYMQPYRTDQLGGAGGAGITNMSPWTGPMMPPYFARMEGGQVCPIFAQASGCPYGASAVQSEEMLRASEYLRIANISFNQGKIADGYYYMELARQAYPEDGDYDGLMEDLSKTDHSLVGMLNGRGAADGWEDAQHRGKYHPSPKWEYIPKDIWEASKSLSNVIETIPFNILHGLTEQLKRTVGGLENRLVESRFEAYGWNGSREYYSQANPFAGASPQCCPVGGMGMVGGGMVGQGGPAGMMTAPGFKAGALGLPNLAGIPGLAH